jgi:hypothetical protein
MRLAQTPTSSRHCHEPRISLSAIALCAVIVVPQLACASRQIDPLKEFDDNIIGAVIAGRCRPSFDWKKRFESDDTTGRKAYEKILSDWQAKNPSDAKNEEYADRAFKLRMEEMFRKGEQMVSEKGCQDPEVLDRLRIFGSTNNESVK